MTTELEADRDIRVDVTPTTTMNLVVEHVEAVAAGVVSLHLRHADGRSLPAWSPGAHIDVLTPSGLTRQYSLSGDPSDSGVWRIAVLSEPNSRGGSRSVHEQMKPGDTVEVCGPRNRFPLVSAEQYSFVVGGIGITPILPMLAELTSRGQDWRLLYGGRSRASMAFLPELARYGSRVTISPQDKNGLLDLYSFVGDPRTGHVIYCCGPEPLISAMEAETASWEAGALHVERFSASPRASEVGAIDEAFEVVLNKTGITLRVLPDQAILDVVEGAGVGVESSCREGICGTCETTVLEGLPDHRDSLLTDAEQAANTCMFICVSRSRTQRLVLDL